MKNPPEPQKFDMVFVLGFRTNVEGTRVGIGFMGHGSTLGLAEEDMYEHVEEYYGDPLIMHEIDIYSARKVGTQINKD